MPCDKILFKPLPSSNIEIQILQGGSDKFEDCAISPFIVIFTAPFDKGWTFIVPVSLALYKYLLLKCFGVCGSGHMAEGGSERHLAVRISEILARKYKLSPIYMRK